MREGRAAGKRPGDGQARHRAGHRAGHRARHRAVGSALSALGAAGELYSGKGHNLIYHLVRSLWLLLEGGL